MPINPNPQFLSGEEEDLGYRAIARLALFWGPIELQIEGLIILLRNLHGETDQSFPVSFSKKVDELKDRLRREPALEDMRTRLRPYIGRAKELHAIRTNVVHSYFQGQHIDGSLMFGRSDQKRGVAFTSNNYQRAELENVTDELIGLHGYIEPFWQELQQFFVTEILLRTKP